LPIKYVNESNNKRGFMKNLKTLKIKKLTNFRQFIFNLYLVFKLFWAYKLVWAYKIRFRY